MGDGSLGCQVEHFYGVDSVTQTGKRVAIVGTAPSWMHAPWNDPGLEFWCLNDMWSLNPPRADRWFELHPLDRIFFRPLKNRVVYAEHIPHGFYVRPEGHVEKLREMAKTIPVYLQQTPPDGWPPNARRLPIEALNAQFGYRVDVARKARIYEPHAANTGSQYWASGPAYEIALAMLEGVSEIQIWGIHLSTEAEYREQRHNFEEMLGIARGRGIRIVMADDSPILKHEWQYAYQPKPPMHPAKVKLMQVRQAKYDVMATAAAGAASDRLQRLAAMEADCLMTMQQRTPLVLTVPAIGV